MYQPEDYTIAVQLFYRLLGFVYFFAIGAFILQIRGLIGEHGILPVNTFFQRVKKSYKRKGYFYFPSIFWLNSKDSVLLGVTILGTFLSVLLMFGILPILMLGLLYIIYLSIVSAGQDFLGFGWEGFLLEITMHAFFLSFTVIPNPIVWVSINLLLFRFHFQAGIVKILSRDKSWKDLTAVFYHYQSQPIPNTQSWFMHKLPLGFHKLSTLFMFFAELVASFGIFFGEEVRYMVFICFFLLQFFIWFTGNFSFLNHLTIALSVILIPNYELSRFLAEPKLTEPSIWSVIFATIGGTILILLQLGTMVRTFFQIPVLSRPLHWFAPFHLANRYGIFAVMTTKRFEIVLEGSDDGDEWKEYLFKHKPSELSRRPRRISPYQPRLDWQAWFLPFTSYYREEWFQNFIVHLLLGTPQVLKLLRSNPFEDKPPKYIRALTYLYEFTTIEEKKVSGNWWKRTLVDNYSSTLELKSQN